MRVIIYAIHRSASIDVLLNTCLAEAVLENKVKCTEKKVKLIHGEGLFEPKRRVLGRIVFGEKSNIKTKHILELRDYFLSLCIDQGYLKNSFLFGKRKTRKFKADIKKHLNESFNQDIVKYIHTSDTNFLIHIVKNIKLINYPGFCAKGSSQIGLYKDLLFMQRAAVDHRFGRQNPPPGK